MKLIESVFKEKFINDWLYDLAYYLGITEVAPDTPIGMPGAPYAEMNATKIDENSSFFKKGFLDGLVMGNRIKTGLVLPSKVDFAKMSGDGYDHGFKDGKKEGTDMGEANAKVPKNEPPTRMSLLEKVDSDYAKEQRKKGKGVDGMNYDYKEAYIEAYFSAYWETRDYGYGKELGYARGVEGGDAMFNSKPEEGIRVDDENAFFIGFNEGRDRGASGLDFSEDAPSKEMNKEKSPYDENYGQVLKKNTSNELNQIQNTTAQSTENENTESETVGDETVGSEVAEGESVENQSADSDESDSGVFGMLKDFLFGDSEDFDLDNFLLLDMFYSLSREITDVQYNIEDDLEDIEYYQFSAKESSGTDFKANLEKLAKLEKEVEKDSLNEEEKRSLDQEITELKDEIAGKNTRLQQRQYDWEAAEAAAKFKINSIGALMKNKLAFDTPLNSNEDILAHLKVNLESSQGNDADIYDDIGIFEYLTLSGVFNYQESEM
ncbi:MAG: hypothetical protein JKY03_02800 [Aureispira sp.]|nr:hypothetical protein [Aureispira sp.]